MRKSDGMEYGADDWDILVAREFGVGTRPGEDRSFAFCLAFNAVEEAGMETEGVVAGGAGAGLDGLDVPWSRSKRVGSVLTRFGDRSPAEPSVTVACSRESKL